MTNSTSTSPSTSPLTLNLESPRPKLLSTVTGPKPHLTYVSPETVYRLLKHEYDDVIDQFLIIDCRYKVEFEGGHIDGAVWLPDEIELEEYFFGPDSLLEKLEGTRTVIIFHCEFSSKRGPASFGSFRNLDSNRFFDKRGQPGCFCPEVYVLKGGYCDFYQSFPEMCNPQKYLRMDKVDHAREKELVRRKRMLARSRSSSSASLPLSVSAEIAHDDDSFRMVTTSFRESLHSSPMKFSPKTKFQGVGNVAFSPPKLAGHLTDPIPSKTSLRTSRSLWSPLLTSDDEESDEGSSFEDQEDSLPLLQPDLKRRRRYTNIDSHRDPISMAGNK